MRLHKSVRTNWVVAVTLSLGLVSLSGCTINIGLGDKNIGASESTEFSVFSQQDLMFARMMIPHHEQALELSVLALAHSTDGEVRDLAQRIYDGQGPEIELMRSWLGNKASSEGLHHEMPDGTMMDNDTMGENMMDSEDMAGMASEENLAELASLTSPEFDGLFLQLMIAHHEGALEMVEMIEDSANAEALALAEEISVAQRAEIEEMTALLEILTGV
jgi:uncharacterized protein (DUF305 family)